MGRCDPVAGPVDVFTLCSSIQDSFNDIYCCSGTENKFIGFDPLEPDVLFVANGTCMNFTFPLKNDDGAPMLKSVLNATAQSPWVRIAFQEYCEDGSRSVSATNQNIITTGNVSQSGGGGAETCNAAIKAFQYGWGTVDGGNRCRVTIIDEKGGSFETWAKRMATNAEASSTPVKGTYKMKVQFGWYITGGGPDDQCGQPAAQPGVAPDPGKNTSFNICSPTMWFLPDAITVNWENGKFIYTLEGVDLLVRGQEQSINKAIGQDGGDGNPFNKKMFFTDAVQLLGSYSMPPFRVRFLSYNSDRQLVSMKFIKRKNNAMDDECKGPFSLYQTKEMKPLDIIRFWLKGVPVLAVDQTGNISTPNKEIGVTINYDSIQDMTNRPLTHFPVDDCEAFVQLGQEICVDKLPDVGTLILWASNGVPHCQTNLSETQINNSMKAVYIVNGGNCSPVLAFNPVVRWHFLLGLKAGGYVLPTSGTVSKTTEALNSTGCAVSGGRSMVEQPKANQPAMGEQNEAAAATQQAAILHTAGNLGITAIEAELRVQGDPSPWLCSPIFGFARCVGIIFINPFFLQEDPEGDCPQFMQTTSSLCNNFLTNKAWWIKGVEHQIKEGSYITTIKLSLPAPGAELKFGAGPGSAGPATGAGGWAGGVKLQFGGLNANTIEYPVGNTAGEWLTVPGGAVDSGCPPVCFIGGGSACSSGDICDFTEGGQGFCFDGSFCDGTQVGVPCPGGE